MPRFKKEAPKGSWDRRKNAIMRAYRKMQTAENRKGKSFHPHQDQQKDNSKMTFFNKAMQEYEVRKANKEEQKKIKEEKRKEREEAIKRYREKKKENFKKLSQKTKWGQPVMKGRMELLLERIQKSVSNDAVK